MTALLILGGTAEARDLATCAVERYGAANVLTSLAGRTAAPLLPAGRVRIGGFGGAEGLAAFVAANGVRGVVDATHPFARQIAANARAACAATKCPHIRLERPPWQPGPGDDWRPFADAAAAAEALAQLSPTRVFLALGSGGLAPFAPLTRHRFLVRVVDPAAGPPPLPNYAVVTARPPFAIAAEAALLAEHNIDIVVCKASGGAGGAAKLAAARARGIPVWLIDRPPLPAGAATVPTVAAALAWLAGLTRISPADTVELS